MGRGIRTRDMGERIARRIRIEGECWIWTGATDSRGYGQVAIGGGRIGRAHRVVYELMVGPIPEGLEPDHLCRRKLCVRPSHLEIVTHRENVRRAYVAEACRRGHPWADETTYRRPDGRRECLPCKRARAA